MQAYTREQQKSHRQNKRPDLISLSVSIYSSELQTDKQADAGVVLFCCKCPP